MASPTFRCEDLSAQTDCKAQPHGINPGLLLLSYIAAAHFGLLFELVEVVHDDTDEQVEDELTTDNHEEDEKDDKASVFAGHWRLFDPINGSNTVDTVVHNVNPAFSSHHLNQSHDSHANIVKVFGHFDPFSSLFKALIDVSDTVVTSSDRAVVELALEEVNAHDSED